MKALKKNSALYLEQIVSAVARRNGTFPSWRS